MYCGIEECYVENGNCSIIIKVILKLEALIAVEDIKEVTVEGGGHT